MSEKKYIDADALISECEEEIVDYDEDLQKHFIIKAVPTEYIEAFPAADVEEVRHGRWVLDGQKKTKSGYRFTYHCSHCFRLVRRDLDEPSIIEIYPYCHCGAKMDKEEKDK